jgi:DNA polymerase III subunit beta
MKTSATAGDFAAALAVADLVLAGADPSARKNTMLSAVRITATGTMVSFTLNTLDRCIVVKATAEVIEPGEAAVALKALHALMTGCAPNTTVSISTTDKAMMVTADRGRFRLPTVPIADMPVVMVIEPENTIEIETPAFMRLLRVAAAASTETARFYLNGIFLHTVGAHLIACGTDGHRLLRVAIPAGVFSTGHTCIVPLPTASIVQKLIKKTEADKVTLKRAKVLLVIETPEITFTTKLIDAVYPDYSRVIPETAKNTIAVDSDDLVAALTRLAAVATKDGVPLVALQWQDGGNLELSLAREPGSGHDVVAAETTGNAQVAVPLAQLVYLLEQINADTLHLSADGTSPIIIKPVGDDSLLGVQTICAWNFSLHQAAA